LNEIKLPRLDYEQVVEEINFFIIRLFEEAGVKGVVIGLSGGVDSSLVATLCVRALGREKVMGIIIPTNFTPEQDILDAKKLAEWLGIKTEIINVQKIYLNFIETLKGDRKKSKYKIPIANILARIRMIVLYYFANLNNYLVAGTGDKSEELIGFFTKYGDGGADFLPISHLYKTQVRELSKFLNIPEKIAYKPSSPQLYPGHKAIDEIPLDYVALDPILYGLFDKKLSIQEISSLTGAPIETIEEINQRYIKSDHKRTYPPMLEK
jgi:NAD+ synthase